MGQLANSHRPTAAKTLAWGARTQSCVSLVFRARPSNARARLKLDRQTVSSQPQRNAKHNDERTF